ncbi:hypothetical protein BJ878DRAFT_491138 [Calycina marina]|uniref:Uncharacterized protein n=1 Tax=Calycina marina TaxID=1763456 RepID=A0A9P7ZA17_9HELO|nr:hypothetical protein BJ878DRAFT_491138 [Calycina marina]
MTLLFFIQYWISLMRFRHKISVILAIWIFPVCDCFLRFNLMAFMSRSCAYCFYSTSSTLLKELARSKEWY